MVNSEGSVFIATANDNAVGMYTCTPYNSYGTMGQSEPTKVILQVKVPFSGLQHLAKLLKPIKPLPILSPYSLSLIYWDFIWEQRKHVKNNKMF